MIETGPTAWGGRSESRPLLAFTLLELLVVIAVVALLASLLLPSLSRAKHSAQSIRCKHNLRQVALTYTMSIDDDGGRLWWPYNPPEIVSPTALQGWWEQAWGQTNQTWLCPSAPAKPPRFSDYGASPGSQGSAVVQLGTINTAWHSWVWWGWNGLMQKNDRMQERVGSYGINSWVSPMWGWGAGEPMDWLGYKHESEIAQPTQTPTFADAVSPITHPQPTSQPAVNLTTGALADGRPDMGISPMLVPRHGPAPRLVPTKHPAEKPLPGAINVVFYDGHVAGVPLESLWQLQWYAQYQAPTRRPGLK